MPHEFPVNGRGTTGLQGIGVLVTRPARQAAGLAQQIHALGGSPVIFPAIVILPVEETSQLAAAHRQLQKVDVAIFVSANAAEYGVANPDDWPDRLAIVAPGPGTAAALAAVGLLNVNIPQSSFDSEGMLELPMLKEIAGKRVLIFGGEDGRDLLASTLRGKGADVTTITCYRRASPSGSPEGLLQAWSEGRIQAATFTSSEGIANLWSFIGPQGQALWRDAPTFVPHRRIAEVARGLGLVHVIETEATDSGLLAGLLQYFQGSRSEASSANLSSTVKNHDR